MGKNRLGIYVKCSGLNLNKFINSCISSGIEIFDMKYLDNKNATFIISEKDFKIFKTIDNFNLKVEIIDNGTRSRLKYFFTYRIGIVIGFFLSMLLLMFTHNRLFTINVSGLQNLHETDIIEELKNCGITRFSKLDFDKKSVEDYLTKNLNLSFVSIQTKGNTININIKEELPTEIDNYVPILATYNMVITNITVFSGTPCVKSGDIVYKGEPIIMPYEIINGEEIKIKPCGEIGASIFFTDRRIINNKEVVYEKTGQVKLIENIIKLGNITLFSNHQENMFSNFEINETEQLVTSYFLPITIKKQVAEELIQIEREIDFEIEKEKVIDELKKDIYSKVPENVSIEDEQIEISSTKDANIVTIYLKSSVYLKYN